MGVLKQQLLLLLLLLLQQRFAAIPPPILLLLLLLHFIFPMFLYFILLSLQVACDGECPCGGSPPSPTGCLCNLVLRPVCGRDGRTYDNSCVARCVGQEVYNYTYNILYSNFNYVLHKT